MKKSSVLCCMIIKYKIESRYYIVLYGQPLDESTKLLLELMKISIKWRNKNNVHINRRRFENRIKYNEVNIILVKKSECYCRNIKYKIESRYFVLFGQAVDCWKVGKVYLLKMDMYKEVYEMKRGQRKSIL